MYSFLTLEDTYYALSRKYVALFTIEFFLYLLFFLHSVVVRGTTSRYPTPSNRYLTTIVTVWLTWLALVPTTTPRRKEEVCKTHPHLTAPYLHPRKMIRSVNSPPSTLSGGRIVGREWREDTDVPSKSGAGAGSLYRRGSPPRRASLLSPAFADR